MHTSTTNAFPLKMNAGIKRRRYIKVVVRSYVLRTSILHTTKQNAQMQHMFCTCIPAMVSAIHTSLDLSHSLWIGNTCMNQSVHSFSARFTHSV